MKHEEVLGLTSVSVQYMEDKKIIFSNQEVLHHTSNIKSSTVHHLKVTSTDIIFSTSVAFLYK